MSKYVHHATKKPIPVISMSDVTSSQIKQIGYDASTNTLAVQFKHGKGAIYHYPGVTPKQFDAFKTAESAGSHFGKHFKALPFEKFVPHEEKGASQ
jgi:hypothetical protein